MKTETKQRIVACVKEVLPSTTKTCIWIIKITVAVSFAMMLLKYFDILPWISNAVSPVFRIFGLPGSAALAYVSGYFVNVYSCIAVMTTLELDARALTILCTMVMCSHSMVLETAVLKKTGASGVRMVVVRTLSAFILGIVLNQILPGSAALDVAAAGAGEKLSFWPTLWEWFLSALKLVLMMIAIIYTLNILQRLLREFGIMEKIARVFRPLMTVFGLPSGTVFLWIVANIIGLGYGAAAMLDELDRGGVSRRDVLLLDTHICISHSNLEDLLLLTACGAVWWILLLARWAMSIVLVWEQRLEFYIKDTVSKN
ncbi:MAG: nucleoside recognition protein [Bacteroidales bacterium]|nr:nucleoside recognition protein [Bacteroidales bacterium]